MITTHIKQTLQQLNTFIRQRGFKALGALPMGQPQTSCTNLQQMILYYL